jgi:hypothetical protein
MFNPRWTPLMRFFACSYRIFLGAAILSAAVSAHAQFQSSLNPGVVSSTLDQPGATASTTESSSSQLNFDFDPATPSLAPAAGGAGALGAAAAGGQGSDNPHGILHRLAFEAGGGFNAPSGDSSKEITWGGQFTLGAGYRFGKHVSAMLEYQLIDDKLPGALIAETGANGGNAHIWSLTAAPVIDLFPKLTNDLYVTGGGGFYRKVTNFTDPTEYCEYFSCGVENEVVGHFSSNQGGWNIGGGFTHRLGGIYGDGTMKLFAEVRYLDVMTPAETTEPNGLGTTSVAAGTKLVPITLGVRW